MLVGGLMGKSRWEWFKEEKKAALLRAVGRGDVDSVTLTPNVGDAGFGNSFETHANAFWASAVIEPLNRSRSPLEERFGDVGFLTARYPVSRFAMGRGSEFQRDLLDLLRLLFVRHDMSWAFVHLGFQPIPITGYGMDNVFQDTRETFPLTSFEPALDSARTFYKEFVKGAFWANFLNPVHVQRLGGVKRVLRERPCETIEPLENGGLLLLTDESPLVECEVRVVEHELPSTPPVVRALAFSHVVDISPTIVERYQRLRNFLRPILLETPEDVGRIQEEVLGSWSPDT